jgi:hypothetical protein
MSGLDSFSEGMDRNKLAVNPPLLAEPIYVMGSIQLCAAAAGDRSLSGVDALRLRLTRTPDAVHRLCPG